MKEETVLQMIKCREITNKELQELIDMYPNLSGLQQYVGQISEPK